MRPSPSLSEEDEGGGGVGDRDLRGVEGFLLLVILTSTMPSRRGESKRFCWIEKKKYWLRFWRCDSLLGAKFY